MTDAPKPLTMDELSHAKERFCRVLNVLWTRAVGTPGYVKEEWTKLETAGRALGDLVLIEARARDQKPKALTEEALAAIEDRLARHHISEPDELRLVAEVRRLRQLIAVAREHVQPGQATCPSCADTVNRLLDDGAAAAPSALPHSAETCSVKKTAAIEREESEDG